MEVGTGIGTKTRKRNRLVRPDWAGPWELICSFPLLPSRTCAQIPQITSFFCVAFSTSSLVRKFLFMSNFTPYSCHMRPLFHAPPACLERVQLALHVTLPFSHRIWGAFHLLSWLQKDPTSLQSFTSRQMSPASGGRRDGSWIMV